jgi:AraC-like DNA-binding protein
MVIVGAMTAPIRFQDKDTVYYADSCEPLKAAAARDEVHVRGLARGNYPGTPLRDGMLPQLRSVGLWDAPRHQSWGLDLHCNEGIEFTYIGRGSTAFKVDGKDWLLRKGDLTITRPWQFHQVGAPNVGASRLVWLIVDVDVRRPNQPWRWPDWLVCTPSDLKRLTDLLSHNEQPVWRANADVGRSFGKLDSLLEEDEPEARQTQLTLYINELIVSMLEMLDSESIELDVSLSTTRRMVEMFLEDIPKHIAIDWTLGGMAAECGLSRSQFSMYCRQITNMTPVEYLSACRIEAAATRLAERPDLSITEIAYSSGFGSSQYFAATFRRFKGCTPSEFRLRSVAVE